VTEDQPLQQRIAELERQVAALQADRVALERLRRLIDRMPGGVLVIGQTGRITEFNPAAVLLLGIEMAMRYR
jgi:two-component system sensor histidine kinase FlrB